jgi:hypothetical protein
MKNKKNRHENLNRIQKIHTVLRPCRSLEQQWLPLTLATYAEKTSYYLLAFRVRFVTENSKQESSIFLCVRVFRFVVLPSATYSQ